MSNFNRSKYYYTFTGCIDENEKICRVPTSKEFQSARYNLDIAGVDLLFNNGSYTICEVNSAPGFEGMEKYTNKNIAIEMVNYVVKKIGG